MKIETAIAVGFLLLVAAFVAMLVTPTMPLDDFLFFALAIMAFAAGGVGAAREIVGGGRRRSR